MISLAILVEQGNRHLYLDRDRHERDHELAFVAFGVVNVRNQFIRMVVDFLYRVTEPALRPIRRIMPNLGGVDISPVILLLLLFFLRSLLSEYVFSAFMH